MARLLAHYSIPSKFQSNLDFSLKVSWIDLSGKLIQIILILKYNITKCLDIYGTNTLINQSSWSKGISKTESKQQSPCSIGLWHHGAKHAASACIGLWCHRQITWLLHARTAWDLKFQFFLGYTFTPATLLISYADKYILVWPADSNPAHIRAGKSAG